MKKLIPALAMLLIAAVMLGTSTYAWFSMNTTVTATGMQVKAKSDAKFLQIAQSATAWNDTDPFVSATVSGESKELYPVHPFKALVDENSDTNFEAGTAFDGTDLVWATTYSTSPSEAKAGVGTSNYYTDVTASVTTNHALLTQFKVRLKPNSGVTSATNLAVTGVTFTAVTQSPDDVTDTLSACLRVLFVCGDNKVVWKNGQYVEGTADSILAATVTNADTAVSVYVYFDGEDTACITNNAATPDDYTLTFTLGIS